MISVGFTGTRQGMTERQRRSLAKLLIDLEPGEFHHGDCVGSDAQAHEIATSLGIKTVIHPPEKTALRAHCKGSVVLAPAPFMERNHDIVLASKVLIAAPDSPEERVRSGTWSTVRYARAVRVTISVLKP